MRIRFALMLLAVCVVLAGTFAPAAGVKPEMAAQATAEKWLTLLDGGKYSESWDELAPTFKQAVGKRDWNSSIASIRKPLGKVVSRKLKSAELTKDLPGAPEGEYVVLKFDTVFQNKTNAVETVTPVRASDLLWRVSGYSVK